MLFETQIQIVTGWMCGCMELWLAVWYGMQAYRCATKTDALSHFHFNETRRKASVPAQTLFPELDLMSFWFYHFVTTQQLSNEFEDEGTIEACRSHLGVFLPFWQADVHPPASRPHLKGSSAVPWLSLLMRDVMHAYHNEPFSTWLCLVHKTLLLHPKDGKASCPPKPKV